VFDIGAAAGIADTILKDLFRTGGGHDAFATVDHSLLRIGCNLCEMLFAGWPTKVKFYAVDKLST
jgi:hypothetical protein